MYRHARAREFSADVPGVRRAWTVLVTVGIILLLIVVSLQLI